MGRFSPDFEFQHTAARRRLPEPAPTVNLLRLVSTHSRPKAAAKEGQITLEALMFQHTAARRRLPVVKFLLGFASRVSTHSRPKAAAK